MAEEQDGFGDSQLSDDPEENLRMENELLRLKLKAELGADSHSDSKIDPGIENMFLKNVLAFEHNFAKSKPAKVYDLIGKPKFIKSAELNDDALEKALDEITDLLSDNYMEVYFGEDDEYDSRTKYLFITEELFEHETTFPPMPGMTTHFDYEEFHPNHRKDIENRTKEFMENWFKRSFTDHSWELANHFILPDKTILSKAVILDQFKKIFDAYTAFTDEKFEIFDIGFQLDENMGIGHSEGGVGYRAVLENGEIIIIKGQIGRAHV